MFQLIEAPHWPRFHRLHSRNITFIVFPLMVTELLTASLLVMNQMTFPNILATALAGCSWFLTIVVFMPLHRKISIRPLPRAFASLTRLNWLRVLVWTLAAVNALTRLLPSSN